MTGDIPPFRFTAGRNSQKDFLRKIIREDLEMELEEFALAYKKYKGGIISPVFRVP
jgi:hypothetical protein